MRTKKQTKPKLNVKLLRKIQKHILEEPRRFFMDWFVRNRMANEKTFLADYGQEQQFAPCGTAACIAGWANILSGHNPATDSDAAAVFIGIENEYKWSLFQVCDWPEQFRLKYYSAKLPRERAKIAAARIDHLIETGE